MKRPVQVTYRHLSPSAELDEVIHHEAERLSQLSDEITSCQVMIELPHRSQRKGRRFEVRVAVAVPGRMLVARPHPAPEHGDPFVAVSDAFRAAHAQLTSYLDRRGRAQPVRYRLAS